MAIYLPRAFVFLPVRVPFSSGPALGGLLEREASKIAAALFCAGPAHHPGGGGSGRERGRLLGTGGGDEPGGAGPAAAVAHLVSGLPVPAGIFGLLAASAGQKAGTSGADGSCYGGCGHSLRKGGAACAALELGCLLWGHALFYWGISAERQPEGLVLAPKWKNQTHCLRAADRRKPGRCLHGGEGNDCRHGRIQESVRQPPVELLRGLLRHRSGAPCLSVDHSEAHPLSGQEQSDLLCLAPDPGDHGHLCLFPEAGDTHGELSQPACHAGGEESGTGTHFIGADAPQ